MLFRSLQPIYYDLVDGFGLPIPLRVSRCGVSIRNSQLAVVPSESFTIELETIVRDLGVMDSEPSDDVPPNKLLGIYVSNVCQWFGFDPFCEIISADEKVSFVPHCFRKWS